MVVNLDHTYFGEIHVDFKQKIVSIPPLMSAFQGPLAIAGSPHES